MVDPNLMAYTFEEAAELLDLTVPFIKWAVKNGTFIAVGARHTPIIGGTSIRLFKSRRDGFPAYVKPTGYIYLIRFMQYHKIGLSVNVKNRLQNINDYLPELATLIHTIPTNDMVKAEKLLHAEYALCRARGEWFRLKPYEVKSICAIKGFWF